METVFFPCPSAIKTFSSLFMDGISETKAHLIQFCVYLMDPQLNYILLYLK